MLDLGGSNYARSWRPAHIQANRIIEKLMRTPAKRRHAIQRACGRPLFHVKQMREGTGRGFALGPLTSAAQFG